MSGSIPRDSLIYCRNALIIVEFFNRAREKLVKLAKKHDVVLRQSYARAGKFALIKHQRYVHAKQFKRAGRALKRLRTYLGRVIRDIARKTRDDTFLVAMFSPLMAPARRVHAQRRGERRRKVYSLHAPEVECIGKRKPHKPYEFGVKASVATTLNHSVTDSSSSTPRRCPETPMTATPLPRSFPTSRRSSASPSSAASPTPATTSAASSDG